MIPTAFHSKSAAGFGIAATLLGFTVLIGWHIESEILVQILPAFAPMQYNAGLGFLFSGAGMVFLSMRKDVPAVICGAIVGGFGFLTLVEYGFQWDLGLDQLFMESYITVQTSHPGRMAPNAALCFFMTGVSIFAAQRLRPIAKQPQIVGCLGALILGLGMVALAGYAVRLETAFGWGNLTRMAVHTSVGFILIGVGMMCFSVSENWKTRRKLPQWFVYPSAIMILTVTLSVWQAIYASFLLADVRSHTAIVVSETLVLVFGFALAAAVVVRTRQVAANIERNNELQRMNDELAASNAEIERFAQIASHDLQEPLRKIHAFGDLLVQEEKDKLSEDGREYLYFIIDGAKRMQNLINDLLQYSRVGAQPIPVTTVNLNDIVARNIDDLSLSIEEAGAQIDLAELPTIDGDPQQMTQLFQNLIANALKFRKDDEAPRIRIAATYDERAGTYRINVADNGIGLSGKDSDRVFEPFRRLHSVAKYAGNGMGLAICRKIIQNHFGNISMDGAPGKGTTVTIELKRRLQHLRGRHELENAA